MTKSNENDSLINVSIAVWCTVVHAGRNWVNDVSVAILKLIIKVKNTKLIIIKFFGYRYVN